MIISRVHKLASSTPAAPCLWLTLHFEKVQWAWLRIFCLYLVVWSAGCTFPRWRHQEECALNLGATREEIVTHLNSNIIGSDEHPGLKSWRSGAVRLHVDGVPVALPASIAVQAPRNFRLLVSHPLTGGQELDIGSNQDRFWIWSKESPEVLTASHEDVGLAIQELQMPVHIHPDWLMEVFGVIPLQAEEFELKRPKVENGHVELVATRQSPLGEDVERVIRVNVLKGRISEHVLRLPGGKVLARARMEKYTQLPSGPELPLLVSLEWPDARMQMVMEIRNPEVNSANMVNNTALWQIPSHGQVVDIGSIARARREPTAVTVSRRSMPANAPLDPIRAKIRLPDSTSTDSAAKEFVETAPVATRPVATGAGTPDSVIPVQSLSQAPAKAPLPSSKVAEDDVPEWARQ